MPRTTEDRAELLGRAELFCDLEPRGLRLLAEVSRPVRFDADDVICRRGDTGTDLYLIVEGSVDVNVEGRGLAQARAGDTLGELAVLDGGPRSATITAGPQGVELLVLPGTRLLELLEVSKSLARQLLGKLARRVRQVSTAQVRVGELMRAYRERGHVLAALDPLGFEAPGEHPELTLEHHGLTTSDLDVTFSVRLGAGLRRAPLRDLLAELQGIYCGAVGVQYMHVDDLEVQHWLRERLEDPGHHHALDRDAQLHLLEKLTAAEVFESFLQQSFPSALRFSLEGAETLIPLLDQALERAAEHGVEQVVIGMAHRGRLNALANVLGLPPSRLFRTFEEDAAREAEGAGDVRYHLGHHARITTGTGRTVDVELGFNPSHLEFVGPVILGRARALQDRADDSGKRIMPLVVHGDAAFAGQGIVQEIFNLSALPGYSTGGAVHVIVNNQVGFTTPPEQGRSTQYATDVARMLQIPIFHVNGERPEAVAAVVSLAIEFRATFHRDVVIDMYCYRRHGHNERDEPAFTQPQRYAVIADRRPMRETYAENLVSLGEVTLQEAEEIAASSRRRFEEGLAAARCAEQEHDPHTTFEQDTPALPDAPLDPPTGMDAGRLRSLLVASATLPDGFTVHPKIERLLSGRRAMAEGRRPLDWGAGEALAFATLVTDGIPVRLSGQDSQRGTFGHRHAVLHDARGEGEHVPLGALATDQASFHVYNSPLSEAGVLGFEFGYGVERPDGLTIWEAQFGDFCNVAQVIVDQFVATAEDKWDQACGLVLFLPHGFEGQGPEHSSARLERFLQLAACDNLRIVNLSTAAQLFHVLRRQALQRPLKPLVVMSPKKLLQHPSARASLTELAEGRFEPVLADRSDVDAADVERILLCSGFLHHELSAERKRRGAPVAILRLEQYYPLPEDELRAVLDGYASSVPLTWVQEEPENMGAWPFLRTHLPDCLGERELRHVARAESASPATGSKARHEAQQERLIAAAFGSW